MYSSIARNLLLNHICLRNRNCYYLHIKHSFVPFQESRLNYADVVFEPSLSQDEVRIIGLEDRIEYADVDIALVAPSSPETRSDTSSSEDDFVYVDGIENFIEKRETNN